MITNRLSPWATLLVLGMGVRNPGQEPDPVVSTRPSLQQEAANFESDWRALERSTVPRSQTRTDRLSAFLAEWETVLNAIPEGSLSVEASVDWHLLWAEIRWRRKELEHGAEAFLRFRELVPFHAVIIDLAEARRAMEELDPAQAAESVQSVVPSVAEAEKRLQDGANRWSASDLSRARRHTADLRRALQGWFRYRDGYDPAFGWWVRTPHQEADQALARWEARLETASGQSDSDALVGEPLGRAALMDALEREMIPYSPEELIGIAEREFAWCDEQAKAAAQELGVPDWSAALAAVKEGFVAPGEQPRLIRSLAEEAVRFVREHDLVTVPPLCEETWRMEMMSPERQRVTPYFTGGEVISVSFPTEAMSHEDKLMSLRGNNPSFCRATVHHELIPGHHLQQFMLERHRPWRRAFSTPFWMEGWALWFEMRLWDLGFARGPEDRVGMLFWRMHRCARIKFSLAFHLEQMTADECVDYLVQRVGHERRNATAEVRRSINGSYDPLYQAAYLLGGLQFRSLHREQVLENGMSEREFHDRILQWGPIPVELVRASFGSQPLTRSWRPTWRF